MKIQKIILFVLLVLVTTFASYRKRKNASSTNNRIFMKFTNSTFIGSCNFNLEDYKRSDGTNDFEIEFERIELDANGNISYTPIQRFVAGSFLANNAKGSLFIPVPKSGDFGMRITLMSETCKTCCASRCSPKPAGRPTFEQVITKWNLFKDDGEFIIKFTNPPKCICPGC